MVGVRIYFRLHNFSQVPNPGNAKNACRTDQET